MAKKLLIIDDDASSRLILRTILEREYEVVFAKNGIEGIDSLNQHPDVSLIITDIFMPVLDGFQFTEQVRQDKAKYKEIPILIMSSSIEEKNIKRAKAVRAQGWIRKPLRKEEILKVVHGIMPPF